MTIFEAASSLEALPLNERLARAWRILCETETADEFAISLDFAMEHGFVEPEFAPQLRGDKDSNAPNRYWVNPIDGSEMVWIPAGQFLIGADQRRIESEGFFLARYPVTNAQFSRYLSAMRMEKNLEVDECLRECGGVLYAPAEAQHPVTQVSYVDAWAYCRWAKTMLPTEWLWEKAARGTDARTYPWGERQPYAICRWRSRIEPVWRGGWQRRC